MQELGGSDSAVFPVTVGSCWSVGWLGFLGRFAHLERSGALLGTTLFGAGGGFRTLGTQRGVGPDKSVEAEQLLFILSISK